MNKKKYHKIYTYLAALFIICGYNNDYYVQSVYAANIDEQANTKKLSAWDMPSFKLKGLDNINHSLEEWRGKVIILNFWASWCAPCQVELKDFITYQQQYGSQGLQIVTIGLDRKSRLARVKRILGIDYPVLVANFSSSTKLLTQWGNKEQVLPYTVVIAKDGHLALKHQGLFDKAMFIKFVKPLL